jgi:hypothetical protein
MRTHLLAVVMLLAMTAPMVFAGNEFPGGSSLDDDPLTPEGLIEGNDGSISIAAGQALKAAERRVCSRTARAAVRACRHEIRDDAWIAYGNCLNLIDDEEREECMEKLEETYEEDLALCEEQYGARFGRWPMDGTGVARQPRLPLRRHPDSRTAAA